MIKHDKISLYFLYSRQHKMHMECSEEKNAPCILYCDSSLTIDSILEQKEILKQILSKQQAVILRANEIIEIDTAALQLLLNFTIEMNKLKLTWSWETPSSVLIQSAELLGMRNLLTLPSL